MNWFSEGYEQATAFEGSRKSRKRFWVRDGEVAVVRFLTPATESLNYKRAYVPFAKGDKYYTSPNTYPDPFVQRGLQLQAAFAWKIIDRRILEFEGNDGEQKKVGPRISYFADGRRTLQALLSFEGDIREQINEERKEEAKDPYTPAEFNLSSFDVRVKKDKGAPWYFSAIKGGQQKPLSSDDKDLLEKNDFDLRAELEPLPVEQIQSLLNTAPSSEASKDPEYSYGDDSEDSDATFFED